MTLREIEDTPLLMIRQLSNTLVKTLRNKILKALLSFQNHVQKRDKVMTIVLVNGFPFVLPEIFVRKRAPAQSNFNKDF